MPPPPPAGIANQGVDCLFVHSFPIGFDNPKQNAGPRARLTRNFHCYLEVSMQSKHCALMRGYCQQVNLNGRRRDGTQMNPEATVPLAIGPGGTYRVCAQVAAEIVQEKMAEAWAAPQVAGAGPILQPGNQIMCGVQRVVQHDGNQYEVGYWYEGQDIHLTFHCYPSR